MTEQSAIEKVRYAELLPWEFRARLAAKPVAYLPLGTIEWHGEHLPLGGDAIQSEGLMVECAMRFGGIVMPPIHLGPDRAWDRGAGEILQGMDYADSTDPHRRLDGSCYWVSDGVFALMVDALLVQIKRVGFKMVFADGHGPSRRAWCEAMPEREKRFDLKLAGVSEEVSSEWKSQVDHAGRNETSLVMHYRPELVDIGRLDPDRGAWPQGVGGEDPRDGSAAYGRECMEQAVDIVGRLIEAGGA